MLGEVFLREVFLSGVLAAVGSTFGKLAGTPTVVGNSYSLWIVLLTTMVIINTWSCRYYLRSLDAAGNSVTPTVICSATNYVSAGIFGIFLFNETVSMLWWLGATLITVGLALTSQSEKKHSS